MSSSSPPRPDRRARLLVALLAVVCALQWWSAAGAPGAELNVLTVATSARGQQVSLIVRVSPAGTTVRPQGFSVTAGDEHLPTRGVPVISDQLAIGMVVDASAAGMPALQPGLGGAANFLLQMPARARVAVVSDTRPPALLAPLRTGPVEAVEALGAVRAEVSRNTSEAVSIALRQLPVVAGAPRLVVLYTSAPDAGGESAAELTGRLTGAGALLAVVTAGPKTPYWSQVTTGTGGVLVAARSAAVMGAFDEVADTLRTRYVLTFPAPARLPARVSVRAATAAETFTAEALVTGGSAAADGEDGGGGAGVLWLLVLGVGVLALVTGALVLLAARRARTTAGPPPEAGAMAGPPRDAGLGPEPGYRPVDTQVGSGWIRDEATGTEIRIVPADLVSGPAPGDREPEPRWQPERRPEPAPQPAPRSRPHPQARPEPEPAAEPEPVSGPVYEAEPEPVSEPEPEAEPRPDREPEQPQSVPQPSPRSTPSPPPRPVPPPPQAISAALAEAQRRARAVGAATRAAVSSTAPHPQPKTAPGTDRAAADPGTADPDPDEAGPDRG